MPEMPGQIQEGIAKMNLNNGPRTTLPNSGQRRASTTPPDIPKLIHAPPNIPPSDEEFEATLENARTLVLSSNDPEMQLAWAQDALQQSGISIDDRERLSNMNLGRPKTPPQEQQIKTDAMNIVTFLAEQHHPKAEFLRGMWFEFGRFGCLVDKKEAFRCYSRSADKGYARAEYRIGMLYEASNDPIKALRHYHRGAEAGDSACLYRLGMMTLRGQHGQQQDFVQGIDLIRRSAACADENASQGAYVYGMLLAGQLPQIQLPEGVLPIDERAARIEIEKAAYMKFAKAQLKMGAAYELGSLGCDFSPLFSLHYYALAARQGEPEAEMGVSKWFLVGHEEIFPKSEEVAYNYAQRAALSGLPNAEFAMGYFNELGIHVPQNLDTALEWYHKAAKNGNKDAPGRIDGISKKHVLSRKDHDNVTISRIKSQYGSQRGVRPARFQQQNRLPSIGDGQQSHRRTVSGDAIPPRTSSVAPYPLENGPPMIPPANLAPRPATTTPYPTAEPPPMLAPPNSYGMPSPNPHGPTPQMSPQNHPYGRSSSAAPGPNGRSRGPSGPGPAPRPYTANQTLQRPPQNLRHVSSPANMPYQQQGPPPPMPFQQSGPPSMPPTSGPKHAQTMPTYINPGAPDIGYAAPLESRRVRPTPSMEKPLPSSPAHIPLPMSPAPSSISSPSTDNRPLRARQNSRPPEMGRKSQADLRGSSKPSTPSPAPSPSPAITQQKPSKPLGGAVGPKTFEEMGVPATKQDAECVSTCLFMLWMRK